MNVIKTKQLRHYKAHPPATPTRSARRAVSSQRMSTKPITVPSPSPLCLCPPPYVCAFARTSRQNSSHRGTRPGPPAPGRSLSRLPSRSSSPRLPDQAVPAAPAALEGRRAQRRRPRRTTTSVRPRAARAPGGRARGAATASRAPAQGAVGELAHRPLRRSAIRETLQEPRRPHTLHIGRSRAQPARLARRRSPRCAATSSS